MKSVLTTVLAITLFFSVLHAKADAAFRCPNGNLVDVGDSIAVASVKCDAPASISKSTVPVENVNGKIKYDEIQEWVYTADSTLIHILKFRNGVLETISTGGFAR